MNPLVLEVWRGRTLLGRTEYAEPSVTLGSGASAMLRVDDAAVAELHAVVNVEDDGTILVLDLGSESGIVVEGQKVASSPIPSGGTFSIGGLTFKVFAKTAAAEERTDEQPTTVQSQPAQAAPAAARSGHSAPPAAAHAAQSDAHGAAGADEAHGADDHGHEKDDIADVVTFVMRTTNGPAEQKRRPPLLEVHQMWGNALLSTRQFPRDAKSVHIGLRSGHRWSFLGIDMGWVPAPVGMLLPLMTPLWSDVDAVWKSDFVVSREMLPQDQDWTLFEQNAEGVYVAKVAAGWDGFADVDGKRLSFAQLVAAGLATESGEGLDIPLTDNMKLMVEGGGSVFFAQMAAPVPRAFVKMNEEQDWVFAGMLGFGGFVFLTMLALMYISPPTHSQESNEIPDRLVELLLDKPEEQEKKDKKPSGEPDAGEGAKAKKEEGKVGKKDAKLDKAKGNKVEVKQLEIDREVAENAGVLGAMQNSDLQAVMGSSGLSSDLTGGIGGLIGASGTQIGSGGLGGRGSGLGGGGTAEGLGGLGTKGMGSGSSGYGKGGGAFGAKGEGGLGAVGGEPIILGALDRSLIDEVIKRNMNQIRYCYQRELTKNPALGGKVVIKFTIAKDGTVSAASTKSSTMGNASAESCIVGRFLRMQFPQPKGGGIVIVSYPFIFSPG
jgi:pSer/pThr/pTyr-binding forkhead associated (FHA) protein